MGENERSKGPDINEGVAMWRQTTGALLIDVRDSDEYAVGHIQGAVNIPLKAIETITEMIPNRQTKIFVHCLSGVRSAKAAAKMETLGYINVRSIGGIKDYKGDLVK